MGKLLKWIIATFIALILIATGAIAFLLFTVDPNDYKSQIETAARKQGVNLAIQGDLAWQLYPQLGLDINQLSFDQQGQASGQINRLTLALNWRELLQRNIAVSSLNIHQADLILNNPFLLLGFAASPSAEVSTTTEDGTSFTLAIDGVTLSESRFHYQPENGNDLLLEDINLALGKVSLENEAFPVELSLETTYEGSPTTLATRGDLQLDLDNLTLASEQLVLDIGYVTEKGKHHLNTLFDLDAQIAQQQVSINNLQLDLDGVPLQGQTTYNWASSTAQGMLISETFNLKQLLSKWQIALPQTESKEAFSQVSFSSTFTINTKGQTETVNLLTVDNQPLDIDLNIDHPNKRLVLAISGDNLDISGYSAPASTTDATTEKSSSTNEAAFFAPLAAPFELWPGRSQVELRLGSLKTSELTLDNLYANLFGNRQVLRASQFTTDIFGGNIQGTAKVDLRDVVPSFNLQSSLSNIDLSQALPLLANYSDLSGRLNLEANLAGNGNDPDSILPSLTGSGEFTLQTPYYKATNIEQTFCDAAALFSSKPQAANNWPEGTQLDSLTGDFRLGKGRLNIDNYQTTTGNLKVSGHGNIKLLEKKYVFIASTLLEGGTTSEQGCSVNKRLQNRQIPFECKGSYKEGGSVSCKPDDKFVEGLIKGELIETLTDRIFKQPKTQPADSGENTTEKQPVNPLEELLKGVLKDQLQ